MRRSVSVKLQIRLLAIMLNFSVWLFIAITCDGNFACARDPPFGIFLIRVGKPLSQKFDCGPWLAATNLINKRAPGESPPSGEATRSVDVISAGWYVARENDAIGSDGDTCLIKLVVSEIEREPGQNRSCGRISWISLHAESIWTHERDTYNYVSLMARGCEKPWCEWHWYLFFKRDEIGERARVRSLFQRVFSVTYIREMCVYVCTFH